MSDFMAYDANVNRMIDLRTCTDAELFGWAQASMEHGDDVVLADCITLLDERNVPHDLGWTLYDAETDEEIGRATRDQYRASYDDKAGAAGTIVIAPDGTVLDASEESASWNQPTRKVYVR